MAVTVSTVKNMGLAKQETRGWRKTDLTKYKRSRTSTEQHLHLQQQVETTERICKQIADCV